MDKVVAIKEVPPIKTTVPDLKQMDVPTTQAPTSNNLSNLVAPTIQAHNRITSISLNNPILAANHELLTVCPRLIFRTEPLL